MDVMGAVEKLIRAEIKDPEALVAEAKERIQRYFEATDEERWLMCSPTYRSKYSREKFITGCKDWFPLINGFEIKEVLLGPGIHSTVTVEIDIGSERRKIVRKISVIKEIGEYQPDPAAPFSVVGNTAPPYCLS